MGWFDTKNKQQHIQVIANAWDMQRIEERNRRRKWFIFLDIVVVISLLIGICLIYYSKDYVSGVVFILIGLFIFLYFVFKKRARRHKNFSRRNNRRHRHHGHRRFRRR